MATELGSRRSVNRTRRPFSRFEQSEAPSTSSMPEQARASSSDAIHMRIAVTMTRSVLRVHVDCDGGDPRRFAGRARLTTFGSRTTAVGDVVLQVVAERLAAAVRQTDAVARVGGEEFLLVLPGASLEVARRVCERARRSIRDTPIEVGGTSLPITLSFGVARRAEAESREDVTRRADEALYEAKQSGRDRVVAR